MKNRYYKVKDDLLIEVKPAKAMIYTDKTTKPKILFRDMYKGYEYIIVSYGSHPCCYIGLDENNKFYGVNYMDIDLDVPEDAYSLGSWMYSKIEDIPDIGDMYQYHNLVFTIIEVEDRRIKRVKIEVTDPTEMVIE